MDESTRKEMVARMLWTPTPGLRVSTGPPFAISVISVFAVALIVIVLWYLGI